MDKKEPKVDVQKDNVQKDDVPEIDAMKELDENVADTIIMEISVLDEENGGPIKDAIAIEALRTVNSNMSIYRDKMLKVCTHLDKRYQIGAARIEKILDGINEEYVFERMHDKEYGYWKQLGIDCSKYDKK